MRNIRPFATMLIDNKCVCEPMQKMRDAKFSHYFTWFKECRQKVDGKSWAKYWNWFGDGEREKELSSKSSVVEIEWNSIWNEYWTQKQVLSIERFQFTISIVCVCVCSYHVCLCIFSRSLFGWFFFDDFLTFCRFILARHTRVSLINLLLASTENRFHILWSISIMKRWNNHYAVVCIDISPCETQADEQIIVCEHFTAHSICNFIGTSIFRIMCVRSKCAFYW